MQPNLDELDEKNDFVRSEDEIPKEAIWPPGMSVGRVNEYLFKTGGSQNWVTSRLAKINAYKSCK